MKARGFIIAVVVVGALWLGAQAGAQEEGATPALPTVSDMGKLAARIEQEAPQVLATPIRIALLITLLSVLPTLLILTTSFTRIVIVLAFIRQALTTRTIPPNAVVIGLALFMSLFVMAPTLGQINARAIQPYLKGSLSSQQAMEEGIQPLREFMFAQTSDDELALFVSMSGMERPSAQEEVPTHVLIPAFVISELKKAFQIGFVLFLPFLMVDLIVASVLLSMGMMMLPPIIVSAPLKILLFVLVDGWCLVAESLVFSFGGL